jgi:smad nuclear-interacting protein 1
MHRARSRSRERAAAAPSADTKPYAGSGWARSAGEEKKAPAARAEAAGGGGGGGATAAAAAAAAAAAPAAPVEQANFGLSGALARDAATGNAAASGVPLKFVQPPEARQPTRRWRFYVFKGTGAEPLETLHLHRASAYLFGRDAAAADVRLDHASVSKQHAVLQFRGVPAPREPGDMRPPEQRVLPYLMDLESANGTFLNEARLEAARYVELRAGDRVRFGGSTREYVLMVEEERH